MKSRVELIGLMLSVSLMVAVCASIGCQADTAIGAVGGSGGTGGSAPPDTGGTACPAGPMAPLGDACPTPDQRCAYGYNVPNCGGRTVICKSGHWIEEFHTDPSAACFDAGAPETGQPAPEAGTDTTSVACCPRSPAPTACLLQGGTNTGGSSCAETCDFWCSINWRVEKNADGCEIWVWDRRAPAPGENLECIVPPDAGHPDSGG